MAPAALDGLRIGSVRGSQDPALMRTAQQVQLPLPQLPSLPSSAAAAFLNQPQPPPAPIATALLGPNVASEAEQISKMLTGQPVATTVSTLTQQAAVAGAALPALPPQIAGQAPTIVVNPSPVTVIAPPSTNAKKKKHTSRIHQMFNRLGNRASAAASSP